MSFDYLPQPWPPNIRYSKDTLKESQVIRCLRESWKFRGHKIEYACLSARRGSRFYNESFDWMWS
jgi:hypothetical protein